MKHLELLRNAINNFKEHKKFAPEMPVYKAIVAFIEKFAAQEDRDFTSDELFELYKIYLLLYNEAEDDEMDYPFYSHFEEALRAIFTANALVRSCLAEKYFFSRKTFVWLEKAKLFTQETCQAILIGLKKREPSLDTNTFQYILFRIDQEQVPMTQENCCGLIKDSRFAELIIICLFSLEAKQILDKEKYGEIQEAAADLITLTKQNLMMMLNQEQFQVEIIYNDLKKLVCYIQLQIGELLPSSTEDDKDSISKLLKYLDELLAFQRTAHDKLFPLEEKSQTNLDLILQDTPGVCALSTPLRKIICEYHSFFRPEKVVFIPRFNMVSEHFQRAAEEKEYRHQVEIYRKSIEDFGTYQSHIAAEILDSLGIQNKIHPIMIVKIDGDTPKIRALNFHQQLATAWPGYDSDQRYVCVIMPTRYNDKGIPVHATLLLFDQGLGAAYFIDPEGPRTSASQEVIKLLERLQKFEYPLASHLRQFYLLQPPANSTPQQTDGVSYVSHCVANMLSIILQNENRKLHPETDARTKEFLTPLLEMNLKTGKGIVKRTPQFLSDLAGVMYLASELHNQKRIELDREKAAELSHASRF